MPRRIVKESERFMDRLDEIREGMGVLATIKDPALDQIFGSLRKNNLALLAGGTSSGKTTLMLQMAVDCASSGVPVYFYEAEMPEHQLLQKQLSYWSGKQLTYDEIGEILLARNSKIDASPEPTREKDQLLENVIASFLDGPAKWMYLRRSMGTTETIENDCKIIEATCGIEPVVMVDFLQALQPPVRERSRDNYDNARYVIEWLHNLALERKTQVIAASKINKRVGSPEEMVPEILTGGAAIGYAADTIVGILYDYRATGPERDTTLVPIKSRVRSTRIEYGVLDRPYCTFTTVSGSNN